MVRSIDTPWDYPTPDEGQIEWLEKHIQNWPRRASSFELLRRYLELTVYCAPSQLTSGPDKIEMITEHPSNLLIITEILYESEKPFTCRIWMPGKDKPGKRTFYSRLEDVVKFVKKRMT